MRVDDDLKRNIAFDNMETRKVDGPITGSTDWTRREIVLDVPQEGVSLHYGFYLRGQGQASARTFQIEEVEASVPVTNDGGAFLKHPMNLDFAERSIRKAG